MIEFGDPVSDVGINVNAVPGGALVIGEGIAPGRGAAGQEG